MKSAQSSILMLVMLIIVTIFSGCTSEPKTVDECIQRYSKGVENNNAVREITKACAGVFDAGKSDDAYYKCLLDRLPKDKTDKDVNISIRKCTLKAEQ